MNHYVYRITDITVNRHYIGSRSTDRPPCNDIGKVYFSSSSDRSFIDDQKRYPERFRYKILAHFPNRKRAVTFEVKIHAKLDVARNPAFFNRARQTSTGFSTQGMITIDGRIMTTEEYYKSGILHPRKNIALVTDKSGEIFSTRTDDQRFSTGEIWSCSKGLVRAKRLDDTRTTVTVSEYYSGNYTSSRSGRVAAIDSNNNRKLIDRNEFYSGNYRHVSQGQVTAIELQTGQSMSVTVEEFNKGGYQGINKGRVNGLHNPNAKIINIFDAEGILRYSCHGNFKRVCMDQGLPFAALRQSYSNNGTPIFASKKTRSDAIKRGKSEFIGWYARY